MRLVLSLLFIATLAAAQTAGDSDGDGLADTVEDANANGTVDAGETDPFNADTDRGGEADGSEIGAGRDPFERTDDFTYDLDSDGLTNGEEAELTTDPANPDTDGDGINDKDDPFPLDSAYRSDKDQDGIPDEYEAAHRLSGERRADAGEDADGDGLSNLEEFIQGTRLDAADTDNDGTPDGREVELGTDPEENPCLVYGGTGKHFADLEGHWAKDMVLHLHGTKVLPGHARIVDGYDMEEGTLFLPDREITRYELLKIALLASCTPLLADTSDPPMVFTDFPNRERPRESADRRQRREVVYTAAALGIVEGYEDGTFRPDSPVNRAEAAKILLLSTGLPALADPFGTAEFPDVPENAWFAASVQRLAEYLILEGYEDGTFGPERHITRAEAAKIVLLMMVSNPHVNGYVVPVEDL